jgi:hypothetical protein
LLRYLRDLTSNKCCRRGHGRLSNMASNRTGSVQVPENTLAGWGRGGVVWELPLGGEAWVCSFCSSYWKAMEACNKKGRVSIANEILSTWHQKNRIALTKCWDFSPRHRNKY